MSYVFKQVLLPSNKHKLKCPYAMAPQCITVHNTANDASAANEVAYHNRNNNQVSYHVAVDDKEVIQCVPFNKAAWHCGDGTNGVGNRKSIGIEICYSKSGGERYEKAEEN
ncbi:peptidoglycan recognition protein family protein, partial [Lysinibacillus sp. 54212]|uniref:peptidoglycan recognition protein family protein n=1 Tax=Lysinibacillus sp. 54212 TaxID=3119829 RepID=UPI002FC7CA2A